MGLWKRSARAQQGAAASGPRSHGRWLTRWPLLFTGLAHQAGETNDARCSLQSWVGSSSQIDAGGGVITYEQHVRSGHHLRGQRRNYRWTPRGGLWQRNQICSLAVTVSWVMMVRHAGQHEQRTQLWSPREQPAMKTTGYDRLTYANSTQNKHGLQEGNPSKDASDEKEKPPHPSQSQSDPPKTITDF